MASVSFRKMSDAVADEIDELPDRQPRQRGPHLILRQQVAPDEADVGLADFHERLAGGVVRARGRRRGSCRAGRGGATGCGACLTVYRIGRSDNLVADDSPSAPRIWMRTSARSSTGTSVPRPAPRSGSTSPSGSTSTRGRTSRPTRTSTASGSSRTSGCAAARCGGGCRRPTPIARSTRSRRAARRACPSRASTSTTSGSTTRCSATRCPTSSFPKGSDWLMVGPSGPRRLRLAVEHLAQHRGGISLLRRPRSAVGDQADEGAADGPGRGLQAPRHRSGADAAQGARRHPVPVHHARSCSRRWRRRSRSRRPASPGSSAAAPR